MRKVTKIMTGWNFTGRDGIRTAVALPHTWNGKDGQDGGNDYYRGSCTYDCVVKRPEYAAGERVYLQFHGVNASAKVIFNDHVVCERDGGYATFRMDVTEWIAEDNRIVVEVDNSVNDRVYPQKADFTFYGGIYRDVEFLVVAGEHFDLDYCGGPGMKYTTQVSGKKAKVHVTSYINEAARKSKAVTRITLLDAQGKTAAQADGNEVTLKVPEAHLWDGLKDPYLYVLKAELIKNGTVVDEISCNCGIRCFEFSPKDGFHLNGRPYPLHGVSRHQDYRDLGNAISRADHDRDMELIREVGANTIRLAHYQHDQYFYDLCDRYGMIVWAEIPYISEHLANGNDNTVSQMKELIVQNYNHPSIVTWGVSNEITISGRALKKQMLENHRVLIELCHKMDPTRPTTLACFAMCPHWHPVAHITDLVGWNLYLGWYVPFFWLNDLWIRFWHFLYPKRRLCYSEYGAEGMPNLHSGRPKRGDNTEEYQCKYHEYMLKCFKRYPYMWATYYWNMFDFAADPVIGALMDRTNGKFGKFRPFIVIGNVIMAISVIILYMITPNIPADMKWLRYAAFVVLYAVWVIGYTFQTSVTRSGQTVLTNDPKQRPLFTIFNTVGSMAGMGLMQFLAPIVRSNVADYSSADFYAFLTPIGVIVSIILSILAIIGIWEKDNEKYFGIGGATQEKTRISEYVEIIKNNNPMQRLMVAGAGCKLALSIATNLTVLCMLYGCMMGNYDGLYLPMMVIGYACSVPFFLLTVRTSQKEGQKASLMKYVRLAFICYIGVFVLLLLWKQGNPAWNLSLYDANGITINLYTILFIIFFGIGYGAYYSTADMPIPMVADCSDYETYRSGKYIPGIMGTLFSLVDKLVSSLSATVVGIAVSAIGLENLPTAETPYASGMNWVVIVLFCIIPMLAWAATLAVMKGYELTGPRMKEIQAVNAARKEGIAKGMTLEEVMKKWQSTEDIK